MGRAPTVCWKKNLVADSPPKRWQAAAKSFAAQHLVPAVYQAAHVYVSNQPGPGAWVVGTVCVLAKDLFFMHLKVHVRRTWLPATRPHAMMMKPVLSFMSMSMLMLCRDEEGHPKGDGSVCYVKSESVEMAIEVLHEGQLRPGVTIEVRVTTLLYSCRNTTNKQADSSEEQ